LLLALNSFSQRSSSSLIGYTSGSLKEEEEEETKAMTFKISLKSPPGLLDRFT
jgi:hypothetical protein